MLVLLSLLSTTVVYGSQVTDCPCVPPWICGTTPYGSHALDIATFGLITECPVPGTVRCCPRDGPEKMLNSQNSIEELSEPSADSNDMDVECDCVPQGICLKHFVTANGDCHEFEELCCMPNSVLNAAVELFINELGNNGDNKNTDALPLLDSTINDDEINVNVNGSHITDCPCVPQWMCGTYGLYALDIATFGLIPACSVLGTVRCCPRDGPDKTLNSQNSIEELSETSADSNDVDVECDCVPQGICLEHFVTANSDCQEFEELCCMPNSVINAAVELFIDELGDNINTDALPLLDSTINDDESNVNVYGSDITDCPCLPQWMCGTKGSHNLDIATFGLIPACPVLGTVRCCPRDGPEKRLNLIEQLSDHYADSNDMDVECDCVPQGICLGNFVTANSDCHESEELCCIPNSDVNSAVELFIDEHVDNGDNENTDALPLLVSTVYDDEISVNDDIVISHSKPQELIDEHGRDDDTNDHALPCVPGLMCAKLYGFDPLDIARFGALPHCPRRGLVRCVEIKSPRSSQPHLFTHEEGYHDAYILPCVLLHKCDKIYGFDPLDIAKFGVLPHCARHGFKRCVQVKDTTGSTPSTAASSPSSSLSVLSETQVESASVTPSLILSDMQAQPPSAASYQTHENGNQDFPSSDKQNIGDQGNSNDDERAAAIGDLNRIKVSMDDDFKEYSPILLDGNNHISEGVNLQVLIPTDLIGTDIHRLIRNHLSLTIGSNPSPGSTEMGQKSDHLSMKDRVNSVDPDIVSIITEVIRSNKLIKQDNVQDPSEFVKPDKEDHSSLNKFESVSFKETIPNQNDQSHPTQIDHVKDPENNLEYSPK